MKTSTERSQRHRGRKHEAGLYEVRGIYAPKADHKAIRIHAELVKTKAAIARGQT